MNWNDFYHGKASEFNESLVVAHVAENILNDICALVQNSWLQVNHQTRNRPSVLGRD